MAAGADAADGQDDIDARLAVYYGELFDEDARLTTRSPQGPLEFRRTQEVVAEHLPLGRVLDIGGGTGRHARALLDLGYEVELLDPVRRHVDAARALGVPARIGDARALPFDDGSFDGALLLGPLYHLASPADRLGALREAARVTRPGGAVLAVGISRYVTFASVALGAVPPEPFPSSWLEILAAGTPPAGTRFPAGHFHTAEELASEVESAGLVVREVVGVEGPAGLLLETTDAVAPEVAEAALVLARAAASVPTIRDFSAHLLAVAETRDG